MEYINAADLDNTLLELKKSILEGVECIDKKRNLKKIKVNYSFKQWYCNSNREIKELQDNENTIFVIKSKI